MSEGAVTILLLLLLLLSPHFFCLHFDGLRLLRWELDGLEEVDASEDKVEQFLESTAFCIAFKELFHVRGHPRGDDF